MRGLVLLLSLAVTSPSASALEELLPSSADKVTPIAVGSKVPKITLRTLEGEDFKLSASIAKRRTVLIFYRGGW